MTTDPALSFGQAARDYDRFRPPYPAEAAEWAVGTPPPARVVDLGAGTGILTRTLLQKGYEALPVEPDGAMRAQLAATTPGTIPLGGCAEAVPLTDGSADAVISGQAYHWFDLDRAHTEAARVLRAGGTFAAIWNFRSSEVPWVAVLDEIIRAAGGEEHEPDPQTFGPLFGPVERAEFRHEIAMTGDDLIGMMTTRSYYLVAPPAGRRAIEDAVRDLVTKHPQLSGRPRFTLPYRTVVYRASTLRS
jgi:SAM-dependent methyltransferase